MRYSHYPKEYSGLKMKLGFGMGIPAKVTWIAFTAPEIKKLVMGSTLYFFFTTRNKKLIFAYGLSIWHPSDEGWPNDVIDSLQTIGEFFNDKHVNYSNSFVFKSYDVNVKNKKISISSDGMNKSLESLEKDLENIKYL